MNINAVSAADLGSYDPSTQLNRNREEMERQRVWEQIREREENRKAEVEDDREADKQADSSVTFELTEVLFDDSEILTPEELSAITADYIGKAVTVKDLYAIVNQVNQLYADKGFLTCRAFLTEQRIVNGVVKITLVEGRTGKVTVSGNKHTRESFIRNSFPLKEGEISNTQQLNRRLQLFNRTNDAPLRVVMKAGEKAGTTDYELIIYEPQNQALTLYTDNNGSEANGRWRAGIFYRYKSLTERRDALNLAYLRGKGLDSFSVGYSMPLNHHGMKLDFDYSTNANETIKGELKSLGVKGHASAFNLTWRLPFTVDPFRRYEAGLQYTHQKSTTDLGTKLDERFVWTDDKINRVTPYVSFMHNGKDSVLYHKHSVAFSRRKDAVDEKINATIYQLNLIYQKQFGGGQILQSRIDAQYSNDKNLSSSDRFYIGGANSVRGYEENFFGGERGFSASLEYQLPLEKRKNFMLLAFVDGGKVSGSTVVSGDDKLLSTGIGLMANIKNFSASLIVGFPLKKHFESEKPDSCRTHFQASLNF